MTKTQPENMTQKDSQKLTTPLSDKSQLKQERLYELIKYAVGRVDWYEDQRSKFLTIGLSMLAATGVYFSIYVRFQEAFSGSNKYIFMISVFTLLATAVLLISTYNENTAPEYTHRKLLSIKSWYHHYNKISIETIFLSRHESANIKNRSYLEKEREEFIKTMDEDSNYFSEDTDQLFALHILQLSKRENVKKSRLILRNGIVVFSLSTATYTTSIVTESIGSTIAVALCSLFLIIHYTYK